MNKNRWAVFAVKAICLLSPACAQAQMLSFWDFEDPTTVRSSSTSVGSVVHDDLNALASQTGGGPAEFWGNEAEWVLLTRQLGTYYPFVEFDTSSPVQLTGVTFEHYHNHNRDYPTFPSYQVQLQIDRGDGFVDLGDPLTLNARNSRSTNTISFDPLVLSPDTYTLRWVPRSLKLNSPDTGTEFFALNDLSLDGVLLDHTPICPDDWCQSPNVWNAPAGGQWTDTANWSVAVPNSPGSQAVFRPESPTQRARLELPTTVTLGELNIAANQLLTLEGAGALAFDTAGPAAARISLAGGVTGLRVQTPISWQSESQLIVDTSLHNFMDLDAAIAAGSGALQLDGTGTVRLLKSNHGWTGNLQVNAGTLEVWNGQSLGSGTGGDNDFTQLNEQAVVRFFGDVNVDEPIRLNGGTLQGTTISRKAPVLQGPIELLADSQIVGPEIFRSPPIDFVIAGPISGSANVETFGEVAFRSPNSHTGQTIVGKDAWLTITDPLGFGSGSGTEADGTIVRQGATLQAGEIPASELIILEGGRLAGDTSGNVEVRGSAVISDGRYEGTISGNGDVTFAYEPSIGRSVVLRAANTYTGRTFVGATDNNQIIVEHADAFGPSEQEVLVVGHMNLNADVRNSFNVDGGTLRVGKPSFDGTITLRNGSLLGEGQVVTVKSHIHIEGAESRLGGNGAGGLFVDNQVTGSSDLRVGGRLNYRTCCDGIDISERANGNVVFNQLVQIDGDLYIDGGGVQFNSPPAIGGTMIVGGPQRGGGKTVQFNTDASVSAVVRGGTLTTGPGATLSIRDETLHVHRGSIDAQLGGVERIVKSRSWDMDLWNIGPTDAEIDIQEGTLIVKHPVALGTAVGGITVSGETDAVLHLIGRGHTYEDAIRLNNATGFRRQGGLILGEAKTPGVIAGRIDLGTIGSTIQMKENSEFTVTGPIDGGGLTLVGDGRLRLSGNDNSFTGRTKIDGGYTVLSLVENTHLKNTAAIELHRGGTLELDKRTGNQPTDLVADDIPIELHGGVLLQVSDRTTVGNPHETLGIVTAHRGDSSISFRHFAFDENPTRTSLTFSGLTRREHATVAFISDFGEGPRGTFGGSAVLDPQLFVAEAPVLNNGIIGPWAVVHDGEGSGRRDFASYGPNGVFALVAAGRPSQLNGATSSDHVRLTATPDALTSNASIATLVTDTGEHGSMDIDLGGHQLNVAMGGIVASRTAFHIANGQLTSDGPSAELVIHQKSDDLRISADIVDSAQPLTLVKSGVGNLYLDGNNTFQGGMVINRGTVAATQAAATPQGMNLTIHDGYFSTDQGSLIANLGNVFVESGGVESIMPASLVIQSGFMRNVYGDGSITKTGPGRVVATSFSNGPFEFRGTIEVQEGVLAIISNRMGTGPINVREQGVLELGDIGVTVRVARNIALDGGAIHVINGPLTRPATAEQPVYLSGDTRIQIANEFDALLVAQGVILNDHASLTKTGAGLIRIEGEGANQFKIGVDTRIDLQLGSLAINAKLVATSPESSLAIVGPGADVLPDELRVSFGGDNRDYLGSLSVADVAVTIKNANALGQGTTTLLEGSSLRLEVPNVRGDIVLAGGEIIASSNHEFIGTVTNRGELNPGESPGQLVIDGDFVQESDGRLTMEIAPPSLVGGLYPQQYDVVRATGKMQLDGDLNVKLLHGYLPNVGDAFRLFEAPTISGSFATVNIPDVGPDRAWNLNRLLSMGEISVIPHVMGDSNRDGLFNSSDFVTVFLGGLYETGEPATWETGDWNRDGYFSSKDMVTAFLAGNYEQNAVATAVPEPASLLLLLTGLMSVAIVRRLTRSR